MKKNLVANLCGNEQHANSRCDYRFIEPIYFYLRQASVFQPATTGYSCYELFARTPPACNAVLYHISFARTSAHTLCRTLEKVAPLSPSFNSLTKLPTFHYHLRLTSLSFSLFFSLTTTRYMMSRYILPHN